MPPKPTKPDMRPPYGVEGSLAAKEAYRRLSDDDVKKVLFRMQADGVTFDQAVLSVAGYQLAYTTRPFENVRKAIDLRIPKKEK